MTEAYRQKLLNWFCTATLVASFSALSPLLYWFINVQNWRTSSPTGEFSEIAFFFGEAFIVYAVVLPIGLFWHFLDFIQRGEPVIRWARISTSYPTFLITISAAILLWLLMATGLSTINSCDALEGALFHECFIYISPWVMFPFLAVACLALALSIIKAAVSVASRFKRVL